jgi:hypothetical protein
MRLVRYGAFSLTNDRQARTIAARENGPRALAHFMRLGSAGVMSTWGMLPSIPKRSMIMGRLDGKVALLSGGARGQGAAEVKLFVREGARVVFGDVLDDEGRQVEADVRSAGGAATYVHLDVTNESDWREAVGTAVQVYATGGGG